MSEFTLTDIQELNQLIHILYSDSPLARRLSDFLHQLITLIPFDKSAVYFFRDNGEHLTQTDAVEYNVTSGYVDTDTYYKDYEPYDDIFSSINVPNPIVIRFSDYYDFEKRLENPAWREFYIPSDIYYGINSNIIIKSHTNLKCGFCLYRNKTRTDFTDKDVEFVRFLQPHLAKVLHYYGETAEARDSSGLFDSIHVGCALFDEALDIVSCNAVYRRLLSDQVYGGLLADAVASGCRRLFTDGAGLEHSFCETKLAEAPFYIELTKLSGGSPDGARIRCVIHDLAFLFLASTDRLREDYDLTKREYDVLQAVLRGYSNNEIAGRLYLSIPSVKKYVASIYSKLGIRSSKQILGMLHLY